MITFPQIATPEQFTNISFEQKAGVLLGIVWSDRPQDSTERFSYKLQDTCHQGAHGQVQEEQAPETVLWEKGRSERLRKLDL